MNSTESRYLDTRRAAVYLALSASTLNRMRLIRHGRRRGGSRAFPAPRASPSSIFAPCAPNLRAGR